MPANRTVILKVADIFLLPPKLGARTRNRSGAGENAKPHFDPAASMGFRSITTFSIVPLNLNGGW